MAAWQMSRRWRMLMHESEKVDVILSRSLAHSLSLRFIIFHKLKN